VYDPSLGSSESLYSSVIPPAPKPVYATVLWTRAERNAAKAAKAPPVPPKLLTRVVTQKPRVIEETGF
jgi:hypothetical protein